MKKMKTKTVESQSIESVICNKCGQSMQHEMNVCGLDGVVTGQFDSTFLDDCVIYKFDLCEECLSKLFDSFKIEVKKELQL